MNTQELYYKDVNLKEFDALVISCEKQEDLYRVVLDRTAFYPEGGGQPGDRGSLGGVEVVDTREEGNEPVHYCRQPLVPGQKVHGILDWDRRFDLMQQHSGEHLVSGCIHEKYGYDNVGFHMGQEMITIDLSGPVPREDLREIEGMVNRYIWEDHETNVFYPSPDERKSLAYRSKKELEGQVRLVEFPGGDLCACCGLHVERSGQIGLVKLVSARKFHEGTRIEMVSGKRAVTFLDRHFEQNAKASVLLSAKPDQTAAAVENMLEDNYHVRGDLIQARNRYFNSLARLLKDMDDAALILEDMDPDSINKCTDTLLNACRGRVLVFSGNEKDGYRFAAGDRQGDVRPLAASIREKLGGRGGGKPGFIQGMVKAPENVLKDFCLQENFTVID